MMCEVKKDFIIDPDKFETIEDITLSLLSGNKLKVSLIDHH